MKLDSEPGKGSRFYFAIPLERSKKRRQEAIKHPDSNYDNVIGIKDEYKVKVLVVDDIKDNRDVLSLFLQNMGAIVTKAENGKVALEQIEKDEPHIVFMDIRMPVMDGVEAFHKIKEKYPQKDIKIVCVTASTLRHQQQKYIEIGFDSYVSKPFQHNRILEVLENNLNVEFNYRKGGKNKTVQEILDDLDWSRVKISPESKTQILEAADLSNITGLENSCDKLESMENGGKELAHLLKKLLKNYDMEEIKNVMNKIP